MPKLPKAKERPWIPKKPKFHREFDNASFYNSKRWRSLRKYFLKKNPLCKRCKGSTGVGAVAATICDHIIPISQGGSPIDLKNLQSLCENCHNRKSAQEGHQWRKRIKKYKRD